MKKTYFFLCLLLGFGISVHMSAQTDPGTTNLKHQWTFDDGTAKDVVGTADGTLQGAATLANKALVTAAGGYMTFDATLIGINTYAEATMEVWFTSIVGAGKDFSMLSYLGNTTGTLGTDYWSICPARNDAGNPSRTAISCLNSTSPWETETGVNSITYADAKLHHMVATVNATNITFYVDGANVGTAVLSADNKLSNIGTQFAYLAKGGYTNDPTWKGSIHKYSIYDKALTDDNVMYLFQKGAEAQAVITTTIASLALDSNYPAEVFNVSSTNVSSNITVTAPAGITVLPTTITANEKDVQVTVIYPGTEAIDGNITFTSGSTVVNIPIKAVSGVACFTPIYPETLAANLLGDFKSCTSMANFGGWGTREALTIVTDPTNVYCGAGSIKIGNGTSTGSGSLDIAMASILQSNTTYRVKVMIKTIGGTFHLGVDAAPNVEKSIDTNGEWMPLEFTFTTGTLSATPVMYINNYATTGLLAYVDNYELYLSQEQSITPSITAVSFDPESSRSVQFSVIASNLNSDIILTAPAGITLSKTTLPATAAGDTLTVTYDGTTAVNGNILLKCGSVETNMVVKGLTTSNTTCMTPLYTDRPNLIVDPYLNSLSTFGGWGSKSIMYNTDSVYCGSRCGAIIGGASIDAVLTDKLVPNSVYKSRAMIRTIGDFQLGVFGQGYPEFTDSINTGGVWKEVIFEFTTGPTVGSPSGVYFNNYQRNGTRGYIDNWEIYRKDTVSAVVSVKDMFDNIYVQNGKIVAEFDMNQSSVAQLSVFTVQGALVSDEKFTALAGRNRKVIDANLPSGMYIVRMTQNGQSSFRKVIK